MLLALMLTPLSLVMLGMLAIERRHAVRPRR
jgi:hypothetical protein